VTSMSSLYAKVGTLPLDASAGRKALQCLDPGIGQRMRRLVDFLKGILLVGITCLVTFQEWHVAEGMALLEPMLVVLTVTILAAQASNMSPRQ